MTQNPNNITAKVYDIVYDSSVPKELTEQEIALIQSLKNQGSRLLDIGCGTGRHLIPLTEMGYLVDGVDSSEGMVEELKAKREKLVVREIIIGDALTCYLKPQTYDLIYMFWNTFNEIAVTNSDVIKLLKNCVNALAKDGVILINIDNSENVDPSNLDFEIEKVKDGVEYKVKWKTKEYFKETNTSISEEIIEIKDQGDNVSTLKTEIKQRYWRVSEIKAFASQLKLDLDIMKVKSSDELYIVLS